MIKFFRKIRQNLLSEGKTGKYLKYAIGEIILVVIGILIALQVNNWNEERKKVIKSKDYYGEIYSDLKNDILILNNVLSNLKRQYDGTKYILDVFESNNHKIDDTLTFAKNYIAPGIILIIQRDKNTFDELKSSGQTGLIKNDSLINRLDTFYHDFDKYISNFKEFPLLIRMEYRKITFSMGSLSDFKQEALNKLTRNYINEYLGSKSNYESLLSILKTCHWNIVLFEESLLEAKNLMKFMENNVI